MQLQISEEPRHGCDDPLLGLTYFDLPFDEACAFLDFLVLQQETAVVLKLLAGALCVCTPNPSRPCECEDCLVNAAALLASI